jgi:hypothetical protein
MERDRVYLLDILQAARLAVSYVAGVSDEEEFWQTVSLATTARQTTVKPPELQGLPSMTRRCTTEHLIINTASRSCQRA